MATITNFAQTPISTADVEPNADAETVGSGKWVCDRDGETGGVACGVLAEPFGRIRRF